MTPQSIAEPAGEPQAVLIAECVCGRQIMRLSLESAKWRHDGGAITCPPRAVEDAPVAPVVAEWRFTGGQDDPPFDDLVKGT